jgi:DNA-binding IclR family transcriptional regulator
MSKIRDPVGQFRAVRYDYDPNQGGFSSSPLIYSIDVDSTIPNTLEPLKTRGAIQSVDRAARILKALAIGPRRMGVSELADRLSISRPTVHGLLQTLQAHGFVEQDSGSDRYQLGPGLVQLGNSYLDLSELRGRSIVHAERLADRTGGAVRVGITHGRNAMVIHHVFSPERTFQVLEVGALLPLHASAIGKAMLAFAPRGFIEDLTSDPLEKLTSRTLNSSALRQQLDQIRERGVARERDEAVIGESSLAAPIFDHDGQAVGAIGVVGETEQIMPRGPAKGITAAVIEAARGTSRDLGAARWPASGPT